MNMKTKHIHVIEVEPDWYMLYLDGDLHSSGHLYEKEDEITGFLKSENSYNLTTEWVNPDKWKGDADTLEEAKEMYDDVTGV